MATNSRSLIPLRRIGQRRHTPGLGCVKIRYIRWNSRCTAAARPRSPIREERPERRLSAYTCCEFRSLVTRFLLRWPLLDEAISSFRITHLAFHIWSIREGLTLGVGRGSHVDQHLTLFRRFLRHPIIKRWSPRIRSPIRSDLQWSRPINQSHQGCDGQYCRFSRDWVRQYSHAGEAPSRQAGQGEKLSRNPPKSGHYLSSRARVSGRFSVICGQSNDPGEGLSKATFRRPQKANRDL